MTARDRHIADRINHWSGSKHGEVIVTEARRARLPISLACALVEQESGFRNVFGHDPTTAIPGRWMGKHVTRFKYARYRRRRPTHGMQGVGLTQLTWWEFQNAADRMGGCRKPEYQCRVAFALLAGLIRNFGRVHGIERYNGSGSAAVAYSRQVRERARKWHSRLI